MPSEKQTVVCTVIRTDWVCLSEGTLLSLYCTLSLFWSPALMRPMPSRKTDSLRRACLVGDCSQCTQAERHLQGHAALYAQASGFTLGSGFGIITAPGGKPTRASITAVL